MEGRLRTGKTLPPAPTRSPFEVRTSGGGVPSGPAARLNAQVVLARRRRTRPWLTAFTFTLVSCPGFVRHCTKKRACRAFIPHATRNPGIAQLSARARSVRSPALDALLCSLEAATRLFDIQSNLLLRLFFLQAWSEGQITLQIDIWGKKQAHTISREARLPPGPDDLTFPLCPSCPNFFDPTPRFHMLSAVLRGLGCV